MDTSGVFNPYVPIYSSIQALPLYSLFTLQTPCYVPSSGTCIVRSEEVWFTRHRGIWYVLYSPIKSSFGVEFVHCTLSQTTSVDICDIPVRCVLQDVWYKVVEFSMRVTLLMITDMFQFLTMVLKHSLPTNVCKVASTFGPSLAGLPSNLRGGERFKVTCPSRRDKEASLCTTMVWH